MGADPVRPSSVVGNAWWPLTEARLQRGWHGRLDIDWRDWNIGAVVELGPDSFGVFLWLGPFYVGGWYQRATD